MPEPLKVMPQAGTPGPSTGNPIWELVEYTCHACKKSLLVHNYKELDPFHVNINCAFCDGATTLTRSFHVEPLWEMGW